MKSLKNKLIEAYPLMYHIVDDILPKKSALYSSKLKTPEHRFEIYSNGTDILFI